MFEQYAQVPEEFTSLEDLLQKDWIQRRKTPSNGWTFFRFSISDGKLLMVEYNEGSIYYVVGFLSEPVAGLPEWKSPNN